MRQFNKDESMPSFELTMQAFENAIKTVGLVEFKKTALFLSNSESSHETATLEAA